MIQIALLVFIAGLSMGGAGVNWWRETLQKAEEARAIKAEQKLAEETAKAIKEAENKLVDMQAAFEAGESKAKVIEKTVYVKGQTYVKNTPVYSNPVCTVDLAGVSIIDGKIRTLQRTAAAAALGIPLPSTGGSEEGNPDGDVVPPISGSDGNVSGVPSQAAKPGQPESVPGQGVQRPPKPKPIN